LLCLSLLIALLFYDQQKLSLSVLDERSELMKAFRCLETRGLAICAAFHGTTLKDQREEQTDDDKERFIDAGYFCSRTSRDAIQCSD